VRVAAIIPTWNRADLVRSVISNLYAQTRPPDRILVVDNGSTDDTRAAVAEAGADCIAFPSNRGFAVAVNEGIIAADSDWLLILNNDVVLQPEWLERVLLALEQTSAAFAVGKLLQSGNQRRLDGSWDLVSRGAYAWRCGYERPDSETWSNRRRIALAPMTAAVFHQSVFHKIGLLETRFESYYEDVDFGIRCALAGLEGVYEPDATAVHLGKATFGKKAARVYFLSTRNQLLLLAKHYPSETLRRFWWPILLGQTLAVLAAARQGHPWPALRGKWQALRQWSNFRQALPPSAAIESVISASEREILQLQRAIGFDIYWRLYFTFVGSK
jgi:GT2 family glycosyltransferase